jgi:catalase
MSKLSNVLAGFLGVKQVAVAPLALIGVVLLGVAAAFAYTGGWLSPDRLTPQKMVDALSRRGGDPVGHRRNHAKGICFTGHFEANGAAVRLSVAPMFVAGRYPVIGRFAIGVGDPAASDIEGQVRSMAIDVVAPDGQRWRSGMNNIPVFPVATPLAFYELTVASDIVPETGKPDPQAVPRFVAAHPEMKPFLQWAQSAPGTSSYADQSYNALNAFLFVDAAGGSHAVRWSMRSEQREEDVSRAALAALGSDFLEQDLKRRLGQGALRWHLIVTLGAPGDKTDDATQVWPAEREQVDAGTLVVERAVDEADGPCREINYDPLIVPEGVRPSDDPLLAARSSAYAVSFDRRTAEVRDYGREPAKPAEASR